MEAREIGKRLVELCREGKNQEAYDTLYADDVVSVEAGAPPGGNRESQGLAAAKGKGEWWAANHDVHSAEVSGPWPHDDRFAVRHTYDVTFKPTNTRLTMDEIALYTVKDGKIVREEFFYDGGM